MFDFLGIVDGVREIREDLEHLSTAKEPPERRSPELGTDDPVGDSRVEQKSPSEQPATKRLEIPDSDAEDDESQSQSPVMPPPIPDNEEDREALAEFLEQQNLSDKPQTEPGKSEPGMLIVDNMTNVLSSSMKNNYVQGKCPKLQSKTSC